MQNNIFLFYFTFSLLFSCKTSPTSQTKPLVKPYTDRQETFLSINHLFKTSEIEKILPLDIAKLIVQYSDIYRKKGYYTFSFDEPDLPFSLHYAFEKKHNHSLPERKMCLKIGTVTTMFNDNPPFDTTLFYWSLFSRYQFVPKNSIVNDEIPLRLCLLFGFNIFSDPQQVFKVSQRVIAGTYDKKQREIIFLMDDVPLDYLYQLTLYNKNVTFQATIRNSITDSMNIESHLILGDRKENMLIKNIQCVKKFKNSPIDTASKSTVKTITFDTKSNGVILSKTKRIKIIKQIVTPDILSIFNQKRLLDYKSLYVNEETPIDSLRNAILKNMA